MRVRRMVQSTRVFRVGVVLALLASGVVALAKAPPARAVTAGFVNAGFETTFTSGAYNVPYRWAASGDSGYGFYATTSDPGEETKSGVLYVPTTGQARIAQVVDHGELVGRTATIGGKYKTFDTARGLKVTLKWADSASTALVTTCDFTLSPSQTGQWTSFSLTHSTNCLMPNPIYYAEVVFETTGSSSSAGEVALDALTLTVSGTAPSFTVPRPKLDATLTAIPSANDIIAVSTRWDTNDTYNDTIAEVYSIKSDGSGATRITSEGLAHGHAAVSPTTKGLIAATRFIEDWDGDGNYYPIIDPQTIYIYDTERDKQWQLIPSWYAAGLGGLEFTNDGQWLVFGMDTGLYTELWKVRIDGTELTRVGAPTAVNETEGCFASDVSLSNNGATVAYRASDFYENGACKQKSTIRTISVTSTADDSALVFSGGSSAAGKYGPWAVGAYDPEYSADDSEIIFGWNVDDASDPNSDGTGGFGVAKVLADGTQASSNPAWIFEGENKTDASTFTQYGIPDWTYRGGKETLLPVAPSGNQPQYIATEWKKTNGAWDYVGLVTADADGSPGLTPVESLSDKEDGATRVRYLGGGWRNAASNAADSGGGGGNGFELNPSHAAADLGSNPGYATNAAYGEGDRHRYYDYNLAMPSSGVAIDGIEVRLDWAVNGTTNNPKIEVELSWDGGTTWTSPAKATAVGQTSEYNEIVGGRGDNWGRTWSPSEFANGYFRVRLKSTCSATCGLRSWYLDWASVRVSWHLT